MQLVWPAPVDLAFTVALLFLAFWTWRMWLRADPSHVLSPSNVAHTYRQCVDCGVIGRTETCGVCGGKAW